MDAHGEEDDGDVLCLWVRLQMFAGFVSVHPRHEDIHQDHIGAMSAGDLDRFCPVSGFRDDLDVIIRCESDIEQGRGDLFRGPEGVVVVEEQAVVEMGRPGNPADPLGSVVEVGKGHDPLAADADHLLVVVHRGLDDERMAQGVGVEGVELVRPAIWLSETARRG